MKYLVLSDIHGNNVALDAVLASVPPTRYDKLLVLGDCLGDGPCPDKVLNTLKGYPAVIIGGNREELAVQHFNGLPETQSSLQWKFMRDSLAFLSEAQKADIEGLKFFDTVNDGRLSIKLVHGSPFSVRELLSINSPQRLNECLEAISENILLCGHNHFQFAYINNDKLVLNPGSVGLSQKHEPFRADYALLNIQNGQYSFELNHVHYDGEKIKEEYMARKLWDSTIWGQIAYREMGSGYMYIIGFARHVFGLAKKYNASTKPLDDSIWLQACDSWDWKPAI